MRLWHVLCRPACLLGKCSQGHCQPMTLFMSYVAKHNGWPSSKPSKTQTRSPSHPKSNSLSLLSQASLESFLSVHLFMERTKQNWTNTAEICRTNPRISESLASRCFNCEDMNQESVCIRFAASIGVKFGRNHCSFMVYRARETTAEISLIKMFFVKWGRKKDKKWWHCTEDFAEHCGLASISGFEIPAFGSPSTVWAGGYCLCQACHQVEDSFADPWTSLNKTRNFQSHGMTVHQLHQLLKNTLWRFRGQNNSIDPHGHQESVKELHAQTKMENDGTTRKTALLMQAASLSRIKPPRPWVS